MVDTITLSITQAGQSDRTDTLEANSVRLLEWRYDAPISKNALMLKLAEIGVSLPREE